MTRAAMCAGFALCLSPMPLPAAAQEPVLPEIAYPALPASAADAEGFVPEGWKLEAQATGDLNGDGVADLALVLRDNDPRNVIADPRVCQKGFDTNPRILAIAFAMPGGGYRLVLQDHRLIPRPDNSCAEDGFNSDALKVARGAVHVSLSLFMSAGGSDMGTTDYHFRWQGDGFRLIGYDFSNVQRMSGETTEVSINYLTGAVKVTRGRIDRDGSTVRWSRLRMPGQPTFAQVGDGMEFDPEGILGKLP